ncbi:hypothetical protein TYRP_003102 [Tyrophagus putrescentiae]|nr:hypothetical protein TYRP_003102 [Tyrophagus putrescentiae]
MALEQVFIERSFRSANLHACKHPRGFGNGASVCVCKAEHGGNTCANDLQLKPPLENLKKSPGVVSAYVSSKKGARFSHLQLQFKNGQNNLKSQSPTTTAQHNVTTIEINQTITYQRIIAFGGAFTDSAGINIASLPDQLQRQLIKDYFSLEGGIGYSLGRVPIGGTDFSPRPYSYDDHNQGDESLKHFALQPEDFNYPFYEWLSKKAHIN